MGVADAGWLAASSGSTYIMATAAASAAGQLQTAALTHDF
jgi:hypothetical protein